MLADMLVVSFIAAASLAAPPGAVTPPTGAVDPQRRAQDTPAQPSGIAACAEEAKSALIQAHVASIGLSPFSLSRIGFGSSARKAYDAPSGGTTAKTCGP